MKRRIFPFLLIFIILTCSISNLDAQELTYSGVGPVNHSLAGVSAALPRDSSGAIYWNPATLDRLGSSEFQLGLGRHNAPWYGDESFGYSALFLAFAVWLVLVEVDDDDDWYETSSSDSDSKPDKRERKRDSRPKIRVPEFSFVWKKGGRFITDTAEYKTRQWAFGFAVSEYGARKIGSAWDATNQNLLGIGAYRFQGYEFTPAVSVQLDRHWSLGASAIFSLDETPTNTLPNIPQSDVFQNDRDAFGTGMQLGAFWTPRKRWQFGLSARTPQWIGRQTFRWIDPVSGLSHEKRFSFSQDSAIRITLGGSYTFSNENTSIAGDIRYYDYSHASSLFDIPATFDPEVSRLGSSRNVVSYALALEHAFGPKFAVRCGYQYNDAALPKKYYLYNTSLPIQSGQSIHYGFSLMFGDRINFSLSISHAFGGGRETIAAANGPVQFKRNPNDSNFWFALRYLF